MHIKYWNVLIANKSDVNWHTCLLVSLKLFRYQELKKKFFHIKYFLKCFKVFIKPFSKILLDLPADFTLGNIIS